MSPCKYCLTRACCLVDCDEAKTYMDNCSNIISLVSMILCGVILIALCFIFEDSIMLNTPIILGIWLAAACFTLWVNYKNALSDTKSRNQPWSGDTISIIPLIFFSIYLAPVFILVYAFSYYIRRNLKWRV